MFKWLTKIKLWRQRGLQDPVVVYQYGRYVLKPVVVRAMSVVMNISQQEFVHMTNIEDVFLNNEKVGDTWLAVHSRLESGEYIIRILAQNKIWKFYIQ